MSNDCKVVGNFNELPGLTTGHCIISVNNSINSDISDYGCSNLIEGAYVGTLTFTGYATTVVHSGDVGRAGCSVIWTRKYDCESDTLYFIYSKAGRSFLYGGADQYATIHTSSNTTTEILTASSQSGPTSLYHSYEQTEGVGLTYTGGPIPFDSSTEVGSTTGNLGVGTGNFYLRSFSIEVIPGSFPVASYTYDYRG